MITVIGTDGAPLGAAARQTIARATLVIGARRLLDALPEPRQGVRTLTLGPLAPALDALRAHAGPAVVLASGDPGFFGIVRALRAQCLPCVVLPAVSSIALAFARVAVNWDDALVVSAHGRALTPVLNVCRAHDKVAVLTGPGAGPAEIAAGLLAFGGPRRRLVVAERLGTAAERITSCTPAAALDRRWQSPNVVLVLADGAALADGAVQADGATSPDGDAAEPGWLAGGGGATPNGWALPEDSFEYRDAMITKSEVRALALAHLAPRNGTLVWDVGAGSGAVAVECARFGAAVIAVERDAAQCERVRRNAARHGVTVAVRAGDAPAVLAALPDPDAVFIGGGGSALADIAAAVAARHPARIVVTLAALERVGPLTAALRAAGYAVEGTQVHSSRLATLPDGTHRLAATNPVIVLWAGHDVKHDATHDWARDSAVGTAGTANGDDTT